MKKQFIRFVSCIALLVAFGFVSNLWAFEIITKDDIKQGIVVGGM